MDEASGAKSISSPVWIQMDVHIEGTMEGAGAWLTPVCGGGQERRD